MKLCPKCAQSFADGFRYCPKDATELVRYDLRSTLPSQNEFQFLLESKPFFLRLKSELSDAAREIKSSPVNFLVRLARGEGSARNRLRLLNAGIATAVIIYASIFMAILIAGVLRMPVAESAANRDRIDDPIGDAIKVIFPAISDKARRLKESGKGLLGGSQPERRRPQGGGGGNHKEAASKGVQPIATLTPQINPPDPLPARIINSTLIAPESIYADPKSFLKLKGPVGMIDGQTQVPSPGNGPGSGVGPGKGPGYGPGEDGNVGDGKFKPGGGVTTGSDNGVYLATAGLKPTIIYKEKARYTEEARQQRIQGVVVLSVVFGADGRIHDIRVIRQLPFGLTETSIEAAQRIRFQPAIKQGRPVSVRAAIEFNFALY